MKNQNKRSSRLTAVALLGVSCLGTAAIAGTLTITAKQTSSGSAVPIAQVPDPSDSSKTNHYIFINTIPAVSDTDASRAITFTGNATPINGSVTNLLWNFGSPNSPPSQNTGNNSPVPVVFTPASVTNSAPTSVTCGVDHTSTDASGNPIVCARSSSVVSTIKLFSCPVEFENSKMTSWKVVDPLIAYKYVYVPAFVGDIIKFQVNIPSGVSLDNSAFSWGGMQTGTGSTITVTVTSNTSYQQLTLSYNGVPTNVINFYVLPLPTGLTDVQYAAAVALADPIAAAFLIPDKNDALAWRPSATNHNNIGDAERHCYWVALMTRDVGSFIALGLSTAHEFTGLSSPSDVHNEDIMDLHNNGMGPRQTSSSFDSDATLQANTVATANAGNLYYLDDIPNPEGRGLLITTNE